MNEKVLKNELTSKRAFKVTLEGTVKRKLFRYNPNAKRKIFDKKGNFIKEVKNDGTGYKFDIKLVDGDVIVLDVNKQKFIIDKLKDKQYIIDLEEWNLNQENKKFLEDMEKDSLNEFETSDKE